ncbi:MAG: TonB-dependent receptor [Dysgonomonas sp.]|nr:TonB-dependent receptor [Dysgonomonas sp.]
MYLKSIFLIITIALTQSIWGQNVNISGKIVDKATSSPIEFANITLLNKDSVFIKGVNSDANGYFALKHNHKEDCMLSISYIGYEASYIPISNATTDKDMGSIALEPSSILLDEATVTAQSVINKADRKLITPSQAQIQASTSGLDLLQKLQLPRINIDYINNKISAAGNGEVQLRINGVEVTQAEIVALRPEEIVRIEFHDDPGVRYGNVAAVLDYITRRKESGGNINGNAMHGLKNIGFAEDYIAAKYNNKKSEFSANGNWRYRKIDWIRTNNETFVFPDKEMHRIEKGLPTLFKENKINTSINYNLLEKDKYYFNARFRYNYQDMPNSYSDRKSILETSYTENPLTITDHSTEKYNTPALDLYFQKNLKNEQLLIFNVVGTYITSTSNRQYTEEGHATPQEIISHIKGDKYSIIAEGIYERKLGIGKLTTGLKHKQTYSNNKYEGDVNRELSMKQAESYGYAQYQFKKGKVSYMAGITGTRFYYSQGDEKQTKFLVQPTVRINYNPNDNTYFRYRFNLWGHIPSLSELNDVEQHIDLLQIRRGNPDLRSNYSLFNSISGGFKKGIFGVDFRTEYTYRNKPIMESIFFEDDKFIFTSENQKEHHHWNTEATFKIRPFKDILTIGITPGFNRYVSHGNNYRHTYTNKYIRANVDAMYKGFVFTMMAGTSWDWFYGEKMNEGETLYMMGVGYNKPNWSIMFGAFNPFGGEYKRYEENWSRLAPSKNEIFTDDLKQMFLVRASFNVNFGRQYKAGDRRINNTDDDAGIMSGAKK